jgi:hypothetical protein
VSTSDFPLTVSGTGESGLLVVKIYPRTPGTVGYVAGPFNTNAEAWRWVERHEGGPINPSQKRAEFGFSQFGKGGGL